MPRRRIIGASFVVFGLVTIQACSASGELAFEERVDRIHDGAIVIDAHAHAIPNAAGRLTLGEQTGATEVDFLTLGEGGVDAIFFSLPLLGRPASQLSKLAQVLADIDSINKEVEKNPGLAAFASSPDDIRRIHESGRRAVLLGLEDGDPFEGDLSTVEKYFEAGVRMITLAPPEPPGRMGGEGDHLGFGGFRSKVIEEMNRLGIIIDLTHMPDSLQLDIIHRSTYPVVASHSCARALNDIPREMPDSIIRALAKKGGVIAVTFSPGHISTELPEEDVSLEDLVDHIDHIVRVAGIDHVGFGSDFLGAQIHTKGLESAAGLRSITRVLLDRGYSRVEVEKVLGGNLLRVFESVHMKRRAES